MKESLIVIALSIIILISYSLVSDDSIVEPIVRDSCDVYHESITPSVHGPRCRPAHM